MTAADPGHASDGTRPIRVAFGLPDPRRWTGGYQYFVNLFRTLHRYGRGTVRPVVFVAEDADEASLAPLAAGVAEIVRSPAFSAASSAGRLADALLWGRDRKAARIYDELGIQVVFESATYHGWRFGLPTIAWLPDFQHRLLPGIFGWRARWQREIGFRAQIASARAVMLSSESSRRDCERFYPSSASKIRVVPFAAELPPEAGAVPVARAMQQYGMPARYFYLPNQFWEHKNHRVVIDALGLLKQRGLSVTVAASGSDADHRRTGLIRTLKGRVDELRVDEEFRFLGLIPRPDVYALMRGAVALINPSLFEGWSTTVEEARALGVPMLLSDIPVHREQAGEQARFFDPVLAESVAAALRGSLDSSPQVRPEPPTGPSDGPHSQRLRAYALNVEALIGEVAA